MKDWKDLRTCKPRLDDVCHFRVLKIYESIIFAQILS